MSRAAGIVVTAAENSFLIRQADGAARKCTKECELPAIEKFPNLGLATVLDWHGTCHEFFHIGIDTVRDCHLLSVPLNFHRAWRSAVFPVRGQCYHSGPGFLLARSRRNTT